VEPQEDHIFLATLSAWLFSFG